MRVLILVAVSLSMAACSLSPLKTERSGESVDILRNNEKIAIVPSDDKNITITVVTKKGQTCKGEFKLISSSTGIPLLTNPSNTYHGKFAPDSAACKDALGENSAMDISLEHTASLSMFGSLSYEIVAVCEELDGLICLPANTFELN
jgi:hypothetical protein